MKVYVINKIVILFLYDLYTVIINLFSEISESTFYILTVPEDLDLFLKKIYTYFLRVFIAKKDFLFIF